MLLFLSSCGKQFLDVKRNKSQVVPTSLSDYRSILNDDGFMNYNFPIQLGVIGGDEYYISSTEWLSLADPIDKNGYIWANDIYEGQTGHDWNRGYEKIMLANFIFDGLKKINENSENKLLRDEILGEAHFFRGFSYFLLAQLFCEQYDLAISKHSLGLPLRTSSNINISYNRSTLDETYNFILSDISEAIHLLPEKTEAHTRPGKAAALTVMAMIYMQMSNYSEALPFIEKALDINNELINFNTLDLDVFEPFPLYGVGNPEILFYASSTTSPILSDYRMSIDSVLYKTYNEHDLRKKLFFEKDGDRIISKGGYSGLNFFLFTGITTAEMYLMAAECRAMVDSNVDTAIDYLDNLRVNRYEHINFRSIDKTIDKQELLEKIMDERRKELILRGRRWQDLRRYINEKRIDSPLIRLLGDTEYKLHPNSKKWVWPIPPDVISTSGIEQNQR